MKIGIQLYSLYKELKADRNGTIKALKEMGYEGVELINDFGMSAKDLKNYFADAGLEICSMHKGIPDKTEKWSETLEYAAEAGIPALITPFKEINYFFPMLRLNRTMDMFNTWADEARKYGIQVGYHNHQMEFIGVEGKTVMEHIYDKTADDFILEVDVCWARYGFNDNPVKILEKLKKKATTLCHFKTLVDCWDCTATTFDKGIVDIEAVTKFGLENDLKWAIVEQEHCDGINNIEAIKTNIDYLKKCIG